MLFIGAKDLGSSLALAFLDTTEVLRAKEPGLRMTMVMVRLRKTVFGVGFSGQEKRRGPGGHPGPARCFVYFPAPRSGTGSSPN